MTYLNGQFYLNAACTPVVVHIHQHCICYALWARCPHVNVDELRQIEQGHTKITINGQIK